MEASILPQTAAEPGGEAFILSVRRGQSLHEVRDGGFQYTFTGQEYDPETGLYYFGARYYDAAQARFLTPDTVVQSPGNPQSLNRYSYCLNNPLMYDDPTGHFAWLIAFLIVSSLAFSLTSKNPGPALVLSIFGAGLGCIAGSHCGSSGGGSKYKYSGRRRVGCRSSRGSRGSLRGNLCGSHTR